METKKPLTKYNQRAQAVAERRRKKVRAMRAAGKGWKEIGKKFGITRQRACQLAKVKP